MEKNRYMISEAASIVDVESHVLRYWEEELELDVPRNEMGHRYYTRKNLEEFQQIKELKEEGYQLKAIKMILKNENDEEPVKAQVPSAGKPQSPDLSANPQSKLDQFQHLMNIVVRNAIAESNREAGLEVTDKIIKEMNYLMRMQDEQDEERYKKLDEAIRQYQKGKIKNKEKKAKEKKQSTKNSLWKPKPST